MLLITLVVSQAVIAVVSVRFPMSKSSKKIVKEASRQRLKKSRRLRRSAYEHAFIYAIFVNRIRDGATLKK